MEPEYYPLNISENNILAASLWAMGVCSCVSLVCHHKKKLPITVTPVKKWDDEIEYLIKQNEGGNLQELKSHINELKYAVNHLIDEEKVKKSQQLENETGIDHSIEPHIKFMFGEGEIQTKKEDKYYHGTDIYNMKRWIKGDGALYRFFERVDGKWNPNWSVSTKDHNQYCKNCSYDKENSKRRTVWKIYKCNGHEII
jgi:hypothetical protein